MRQIHTLPALAALVVVVSAQAQGKRRSASAGTPGLPQPQVFEALRGSPENPNGYFFSVSPDEEWIAVLGLERSRDTSLRVLHRRSGKTWDTSVSDTPLEGFPDCFTADGRRIVLAGAAAELSPTMGALELRPLARGDAPRCTFLGFPARLLGGSGRERRSWISVPQAEGEFGEVAWSEGGVRYASFDDGNDASSWLRVEPPGRRQDVDFSAVLDAERDRLRAAAAKLPARFAAALRADGDTRATVRLAQLSVSPDGKHLAAVATVFRGSVGFGGRPYGVLIPVGGGDHAARPFAINVYGKVLWSSDARVVYYYAQPEVGTGNGTVHRLEVAGIAGDRR